MASVSKAKVAPVTYHDRFDYPLTKEELNRWGTNIKEKLESKNGFYYLQGREKIIKLRQKRDIYSKKKLILARKIAGIFSKIPTVMMVGITGSLAMHNANFDSDIDLLIVTQKNMLWTTRLIILVLLLVLNIPIRRAGDKIQKNRFCLNMWLDESDLYWSEQNAFTAHEIAQIIPLVNKDHAYEKFIYINKWVLKYWPRAVKVYSAEFIVHRKKILCAIVEPFARVMQYWYMKSKITNEVITPTRALFHPHKLY